MGFGTFEPRARAARKGRNPSTGAEIDIPATVVPSFSAGTRQATIASLGHQRPLHGHELGQQLPLRASSTPSIAACVLLVTFWNGNMAWLGVNGIPWAQHMHATSFHI